MKSLLISLTLVCFALAEDKPAFTDPALSTYTKSIEDIDQKALVSKREARNKTVVALEAAIKKAMAAGDLDRAVFLKGEKERIAKEWVSTNSDLAGDKSAKLEEAILGKWNQVGYNAFYTFYKNHKFICSAGSDWSGTYTLSESVITTKANNGQNIVWTKNDKGEYAGVGILRKILE